MHGQRQQEEMHGAGGVDLSLRVHFDASGAASGLDSRVQFVIHDSLALSGAELPYAITLSSLMIWFLDSYERQLAPFLGQ